MTIPAGVTFEQLHALSAEALRIREEMHLPEPKLPLMEKVEYDARLVAMFYNPNHDARGRFTHSRRGGGKSVSRFVPGRKITERAVAINAKAMLAEPTITGHMHDLEVLIPGSALHGLRSRIKEPGSMARKIATKMDTKGITMDKAATSIKDAVRYTLVIPDDGYWEKGTSALNALEAKGYKLTEDVNGWAMDGYRGRNTTMEAPDGTPIEIQFHTGQSLKWKEPGHKLYEEFRLPTTPVERQIELNAEMSQLYANIPIPVGTPVFASFEAAKVIGTVHGPTGI